MKCLVALLKGMIARSAEEFMEYEQKFPLKATNHYSMVDSKVPERKEAPKVNKY